jgi:hypothetical protein
MSNKNIKKKLIKLFAAHSAAEIDAGKGTLLKEALGVEKYSQLINISDDTFKKYYLTIKGLRKKLDIAADEKENIEQIKGCLYLLLNLQENDPSTEHFEILSLLIKQGFYKNWNREEKKYYDTGYKMLAQWTDYFLSYTNRNSIETNNDFRGVLCDAFGNDYINQNKEGVNCVARLIVHYLKQNNLTAFFDQDSMTCGDMIEDEISKHCKSVYAFVQLVEPLIFQAQDENNKNWCFLEYKTFDGWSSKNHLKSYKRYYFILTGKDVFPAKFPKYYKDWKEKIQQHLHIQDLGSLNKKQVRDKIKEIATEIVKTKTKILEDYIGL